MSLQSILLGFPLLIKPKVRRFLGIALSEEPELPAMEKAVPHLEEMAEAYLRARQGVVKQSTLSTYETVIHKHLVPAFGTTPVTALTQDTINGFLRDKVFCQEDALTATTVRSIVTALRGILQFSAEAGWDVLDSDSVHGLGASGNEARVLSAAEQTRLKQFCCNGMDLVKLAVLICLYTGLRIGEICAMKWGDISLEKGTITVRRTIQRIKNPEYAGKPGQRKTVIIFDAPKSKCANRCIPMPTILVGYMERFHMDDDHFLLTGSASVWMEPRALQNKFQKLLKQAQISHINFHGLRHPYVKHTTKIFSLRLKFFQAQPVPDALQITCGAFL